MKKFIDIHILIILFATAISYNTSYAQNDKPYVIMLSMDGFRWDYPEKANTLTLDQIELIGVKAEASIPCFPTKTFPNHYSIATGLYPDHHGIILNSFYASDLKKKYAIGKNEAVTNPDFYFGEPIWVTAEKQGIKSASYFWVGSEAPHQNIFPSYYNSYDESIPFEDRIDRVINWLKLPDEKRPHLILLYIHQPDNIGHDVGPNSPKIITMVEYLDSLLGVFTDKLNKLPFTDKINVIITSDHGMSEISTKRNIYLNNIVKKEWCKEIDGGNPVYSIEAKKEYYDTIYNILSTTKHLKIWKKNEIPERLHFGTNSRVKDFVIVADSSWSIWESPDKISYVGGAHGYDNANKDMHAIFYAFGPAFKIGYKHHPINNIDIYPLICKILNLDPSKVDGSFNNIKDILKNPE